jgi:hypothetical protein
MRIVFIISAFILVSCNANKRWIDKGKRKGWLDTITTVKYDTIRIQGSTKDTSFLFRSDTIFLKDKHFTTYYFRDTITKKEYLKTIVHSRDTIVKVEENKTVVNQINDKLPWWVYVVGGVMLFVIVILVIKK